MLPRNFDPREEADRPRFSVPDVRGPRQPVGWQPSFQLEERLQGLLVLLMGVVGLAGVALFWNFGGTLGPPPPPGPAGLRVPALISASNCLLPMIAVGSVGLILVGARRMINP